MSEFDGVEIRELPATVSVSFIDSPDPSQANTEEQRDLLEQLAQIRAVTRQRFGRSLNSATLPEFAATLLYNSNCKAQFFDMETGEPWKP